jgi:salicylate hydroxylase
MDHALSLGVEIRLASDVTNVSFSNAPTVTLSTGESIAADVIVGADGLWSTIRDLILNRPSPPTETGDLAYRATVSRQELEDFHDPRIDELLNKAEVTAWLGPEKHCVFYPVRNKTQYNLVLLSVPTHT